MYRCSFSRRKGTKRLLLCTGQLLPLTLRPAGGKLCRSQSTFGLCPSASIGCVSPDPVIQRLSTYTEQLLPLTLRPAGGKLCRSQSTFGLCPSTSIGCVSPDPVTKRLPTCTGQLLPLTLRPAGGKLCRSQSMFGLCPSLSIRCRKPGYFLTALSKGKSKGQKIKSGFLEPVDSPGRRPKR